MLRRVLVTITIMTVIAMPVVQRHEVKAEGISWQKGWMWSREILEMGPYSEVKTTIRGFVQDFECHCNPETHNCDEGEGWGCTWPGEPPSDDPGWFTLSTSNNRRQYSILWLHTPSVPVGPLTWGGLTGYRHVQMFYSGSPYSVVGIDQSTELKILSTEEGEIKIKDKNLCNFDDGSYLGVPGWGYNPSNRHGGANTLGTCIKFNEITNLSFSGCDGYVFNSVAFDRDIPTFGPDHGVDNKLYAAMIDRPTVHVSRAGYVFGKEGQVILPDSYGVTDEDYRVWAEFGTFSRDRTILIAPTAKTGDFVYNNRSFVFRMGNIVKSGSNVVMYAADSDHPSNDLIIQSPPLRLYNHSDTHSIQYSYAVGVASRNQGKYFVAHSGSVTVPADSFVSIVIPDIVVPKEYIVPNEELTVRGVVVGDRGDTSAFLTREFYAEKKDCGFTALIKPAWFVESFANSRTHREENMLGFLPVVHALYTSYVLPCQAHLRQENAIAYVRYVGDVAQASVKFISASLSLSGSTEVSLGLNLRGSAQFWPNNSEFYVSTDVPLNPQVEFNPQMTVSYVVTDTNTGQVYSGTVSPNLYEIQGWIQSDFADGVWGFGNLVTDSSSPWFTSRKVVFSPSEVPKRFNLTTYRTTSTPSCPSGYTTSMCNGIAFNIPDFYHARDKTVEVYGTIRVRARVTITIGDEDYHFWTKPGPVIPVRWKAILVQERR